MISSGEHNVRPGTFASVNDQANVMAERTSVTKSTIEVLRQIRSNARQVLRKHQALDEVNFGMADDKSRIETLQEEFETLRSQTGGQDQLDEMKRIGSNLIQLDKLRVCLAEELSTYKSDLLYLRERLEDELWLALVESGQVEIEDDVSDGISSRIQTSMEDSCGSADGHRAYKDERNDPGAEKACSGSQSLDTSNVQIRKAMSFLGSAKENLQAATTNFIQLDKLCEAQRREFSTHMIPEWRGMSKTEFDLGQLAQKIELTRELVRAERAFSEAGRYAVEVGFIRDDPDQSCHFVDEPEDGASSGDRWETLVEQKDMDFIKAWRENVAPASLYSPVSVECDVWEVDSVYFGEGCSTHADEWNKTRIDRFERSREVERVKMSNAGCVAFPDEVLCQHSPAIDGQRLSPVAPNECAAARAEPWKTSLATGIMKELLVSGHAAVAKISATWSSRRSGDKSVHS